VSVLALAADDARTNDKPPSDWLELQKPCSTMAPKQHTQRQMVNLALDLLDGAHHRKIPI
jgi:hypothetical protein